VVLQLILVELFFLIIARQKLAEALCPHNNREVVAILNPRLISHTVHLPALGMLDHTSATQLTTEIK
jgi:hypothetical protein